MFKEVYKKENGKPALIKSHYNANEEKEVFNIDDKKYTETKPPNTLYDPIYYNDEDKEWKGATHDEWLENLKNDDEQEVPENDKDKKSSERERDEEIAMITKLLFDSRKETEDLQQDFAELVKQLNDKEEQI